MKKLIRRLSSKKTVQEKKRSSMKIIWFHFKCNIELAYLDNIKVWNGLKHFEETFDKAIFTLCTMLGTSNSYCSSVWKWIIIQAHLSHSLTFFLPFIFIFVRWGSLYVVQNGLSLPDAGITGLCHYVWQFINFTAKSGKCQIW